MSPKMKVFLTRLLPSEAMECLRALFDLTYNPQERQLKRKEIIRGAAGKQGLISMLSDAIDKEVIESCPSLKVISNYAVGINNIDRQFNNEVQHLGERKGKCYPKCLCQKDMTT
ncbi:MAG: hypothetical protein ACREIQ_13105 [Nitrospiria bacterium]